MKPLPFDVDYDSEVSQSSENTLTSDEDTEFEKDESMQEDEQHNLGEVDQEVDDISHGSEVVIGQYDVVSADKVNDAVNCKNTVDVENKVDECEDLRKQIKLLKKQLAEKNIFIDKIMKLYPNQYSLSLLSPFSDAGPFKSPIRRYSFPSLH